MSELLTSEEFDAVAHATWQLAKVSCADLLEICPPNAWVKGEVQVGNICVEPKVFVNDPASILEEELPRDLQLVVSETELYRGRQDLTLYSAATIELDTLTREWELSRSQMILGEAGRTIEVVDTKPLRCQLDDRFRLGARNTRKWQDIYEGLEVFDHQEAMLFLSAAKLALNSFTQNS